MRRWGQIAEAKPDGWYADVAKKVYRPEIYLKAAKLLVAEGKAKEADFPWNTRRLSRADDRFHRRHRLRRPQAERLHRQAGHRPEGPAEGRGQRGRRGMTCCPRGDRPRGGRRESQSHLSQDIRADHRVRHHRHRRCGPHLRRERRFARINKAARWLDALGFGVAPAAVAHRGG